MSLMTLTRMLELLVWICLVPACYSAQCEFPKFLRQPMSHRSSGVEPRYWITETKYRSTSPNWESQMEMHVTETEVVAKVKFKAKCLDQDDAGPCYQREIAYRRKCLSSVAHNKFRVSHTEGGSSYVTCMKFVLRNPNVVQIFQGVREDKQETDVCAEHLLQREDWPWIAPVQEQTTVCPISAGYDFRTVINKNRELCPGEWRPSRLETECLQGDGMTFTFISAECSPFDDKRLEIRLICWASWEEEGYLFIVASEMTSLPQYVLRLQQTSNDPVMKLNWFFSPTCPVNRRGVPTGNTLPVTVLDMLMNKSEPGICYDDSTRCAEHAKECRGVNNALFQYANFCKRSCGLCHILPSPRSECRFPPEYHGQWYFFDNDRSERVTITSENITFSILGNFVCKSVHWSINYYKLFSYYNNGCRPRYTCLNLEKDNDNVLRFQMSLSSSTDLSFDLCTSSTSIHSTTMKILIPFSKVKSDTCGLHGTVSVFTRPEVDIRTCWGKLSDWNQRMCGSTARLRLRLQGQCSATDEASTSIGLFHHDTEYFCYSYMTLDDTHALLVTKSTSLPEKYACWAIKTYPTAERNERSTASYAPWREVYQLPSAQCGSKSDFHRDNLRTALLSLTVESDEVQRPCGQNQPKTNSSTFNNDNNNNNNNNNRGTTNELNNDDNDDDDNDSADDEELPDYDAYPGSRTGPKNGGRTANTDRMYDSGACSYLKACTPRLSLLFIFQVVAAVTCHWLTNRRAAIKFGHL